MSLNSNKLRIITNYKKFIFDIEKMLVNVPKKDYLSRNTLYEKSIEILELIFYTNNLTSSTLRKENQIKIVSKISVLDFYLERLYKKKYISESYLAKLTNNLNEITKMIYGWIKEDT